jgi:hypothetical protein
LARAVEGVESPVHLRTVSVIAEVSAVRKSVEARALAIVNISRSKAGKARCAPVRADVRDLLMTSVIRRFKLVSYTISIDVILPPDGEVNGTHSGRNDVQPGHYDQRSGAPCFPQLTDVDRA